MKDRIKVLLKDGNYIMRVPRVVPFGNFQMMIVRYKNNDYIINEGDEYLRGNVSSYTLGKKLDK